MEAQFLLRCLYHKGKHVKRDIHKAIHYYTLAANQNDPDAQFKLGSIYFYGDSVKIDTNKAFHYYFLAANHGCEEAQFKLGFNYYIGELLDQNINKAIFYFHLSARNGCVNSHFVLGVIYSQGIHVKRNIDEAIHHYNNGSNVDDQYSKNNLGIIYKHFQYKKSPVEYFEEAIRKGNDPVSMYNLGHIYFYGEKVIANLEKSIDLLIRSSLRDFHPSTALLSLVLIKKITGKKLNREKIQEEIGKNGQKTGNLASEVIDIILMNDLDNEIIYNYFYEQYKTIDFTYNFFQEPMVAGEFLKRPEIEKNK